MLTKTMLASHSLWLTEIRMIPAMNVAGPVMVKVKSAAHVIVSLTSFNGFLRVACIFTLAFTSCGWRNPRSTSFIVPAFKRPAVEPAVVLLLPGMLDCLAKDDQSQGDRQNDEPKQHG